MKVFQLGFLQLVKFCVYRGDWNNEAVVKAMAGHQQIVETPTGPGGRVLPGQGLVTPYCHGHGNFQDDFL